MKRVFLSFLLVVLTAAQAFSIVVTSVTDDPADPDYATKSLRHAIEQINLTPDTAATITFDVVVADAGPSTVSLQSPLPEVLAPVTMVGQVATDGTTPMVQIDGASVGGDGLVFDKPSTLDALSITGFSGSGVVFKGNGSKLTGCYVGLDCTGMGAGNGVGVTVTGSNCLIGTGTAGRGRNVISGNSGAGLLITGGTAIANNVRGNLIGSDPTGSFAIPNDTGVQIDNGASINYIGLTADVYRNTISGNATWGISVQSGSANRIENNWVGPNLFDDGNTIPNGPAGGGVGGGILVDDAATTTIKKCVISGNAGNGIQIIDGAHDTTIVSSNIGVDRSGLNPLANSGDGIVVGDPDPTLVPVWNTTIGGLRTTGTTVIAGLGNLISGNLSNGINIISGNNDIIQGNFIGLSSDSTLAVPNGLAGIQLTGTDETVGGSTAGAGNLISGNTMDGIAILNSARVTISGNILGLDATGTFGIPNGQNGLNVQTSDFLQIGGTSTGARNVISGNTASGILLNGDSNTVLGNYIGCSSDGTSILGNGTVSTSDAGIALVTGSMNTIGGISATAGNYILGNIGDGISLSGANTWGNVVIGNTIGFGVDGSVDPTLANGQNGVGLYSGANNNLIGALNLTGNLISANAGDAIFVSDAASVQNSLRGNSILILGTGLPIDLAGGNSDHSGPNNLMDQPVISDVSYSGSNLLVGGTYSSLPGIQVSLDLYRIDPNGAIPFYQYVSTTAVVTGAAGDVPFTIPVSGAYAGQTFALAATDANGNTSPFSADADAPKLFKFVNGGAPVSVKESAGKLTLTITRQGDISQGDSIEFATRDISARAGIDYVGVSGTTVYFTSGHSTAQISITLLNNSIPNGERLFQVLLSNPSSGVLAGSGIITVSITDNQAPNGVFSVTAATPFVDEGKVTSVAFVIKRNGGLLTPATVTYTTINGTAVAGTGKDYTSTARTLAFGATQTSGTVTVPILSNAAYKYPMTFTFALTACSTGCALVDPKSAVQTICDLANPYGAMELSVAETKVNEVGPNGIVTVTRLGGTTRTVTVRYATSNGTALAGVNYRTASGILTFKPAQKSGTISVPLIDDHVFGVNKNFYVTLSSPAGGATLGALRTGLVTMIDSDNPAGVFQFASTSVTAVKGARTVAVKVSRLGGTSTAVSVPYTFQNGTARSGVNFTGKNGSLSFGVGVNSATINVPIIGSLVHSSALTFGLTLGAPTAGATLGVQSKVTVVLP